MKPVIVHSIGRCGSRSIYQTLRHNGFTAFHCHSLTERTRRADAAAHERIQGQSVFTIIPIREPIGRNLSAYFNNNTEYSVDDFIGQYPPTLYDRWFDAEVLNYWGVDVFDEKLQNGWHVYDGRLLVIRLQDFDKWAEAFKALTGKNAPQLEMDGRTTDGRYEFVKQMAIPGQYVAEIEATRYYRHFFGN